MATIMYEPKNSFYVETSTPNTILSFINNNFPELAKLIKFCNVEKYYNASQNITFFLPINFTTTRTNDRGKALQYIKALTLPYFLNEDSLASSQVYVLKTLSATNDIIVNCIADKITVNSIPVIDSIRCCNGLIYLLTNSIWCY